MINDDKLNFLIDLYYLNVFLPFHYYLIVLQVKLIPENNIFRNQGSN